MKNVLQASERAATLTKQLLAYSGQGRFVIEPLDLSALVQQIVCLVQANISKLVSLELELASALPCIEADSSQIQQIIMNLVMNAAEAIEDRAGPRPGAHGAGNWWMPLTIQSQSLPEELVPGRYVFLEVQDTGCGMPPEVQAKIFDPFLYDEIHWPRAGTGGGFRDCAGSPGCDPSAQCGGARKCLPGSVPRLRTGRSRFTNRSRTSPKGCEARGSS